MAELATSGASGDSGPAPAITFTADDKSDDLFDKKSKDDLIGLQKRHIAEETATADETERALKADRSRAANYLDREGIGPNDLQKWDADRERQKYETNPLESFGSLASVFAIAASAFTHAPMENALNGSAAAMNAVRARDDKAYDRAFAAFKENMDLAVKRHQMMHENYQDAMDLMLKDSTLGEAKMREQAVRFGDQKLLFYLDHFGMTPEIAQILDARATSMEKMIKVREETTKQTYMDQVYNTNPDAHLPVTGVDQATAQKNAQLRYQAWIKSRSMDIKEPPDTDMYNRAWAAVPKDLPFDQAAKWVDKQMEPWFAAKYANRGIAGEMAPIANDVAREHPDWTPGQVVEETLKRRAAATHADHPTMSGELAKLVETKKLALRQQHPDWTDEQVDSEAIKQAKQLESSIAPDQLAKIGWDKDTIDAAARTYNKTGMTPRYLGSRTVSAAIMGAVQNRATALLKEEGITPEQRAKNWQKFASEKVAIQRFESGPQGNTIRSLGVVVDHLATLRHLATALDNGDIPMFNKLAQSWAEQTGSPIPTNFDEAKQIVGTEIIKALGVAGAGTQAERAEASESFARWRSPSQLLSGIDDVMRPLMLGQLKGLERQFTQSTGLPVENFYAELGPEAEKFLRPTSKVEKPIPTQVDIDYAKAHPDVVDKFRAKFGRDP
jgi:hypothetical protein